MPHPVVAAALVSWLLVCHASAAPTLADALDAVNLSWQTGGDAPWFGQNTLTHDGVDAAQSGAISDSQASWVQTTVMGPGTLSFWWKVSSEQGYDELLFLVDGIEQVSITGEVDWQQRSFDLPAGAHVVQWSYAKDVSGSAGSDQGWLDQVSFTGTGDSAPVIQVQPVNQTAGAGATVSFSVTVSGTPTPSFAWRFGGVRIPQGTNATLTLYGVATNQAGTYDVIASNYLGSVTSAPVVLQVSSIGDAVDAPGLVWVEGGDGLWFGQSLVSYDGVDALQSGAITNSEETWVETVVAGPGVISFWWKVSSEPQYDGLQFLTNGVVAASLSGEASWELQTFSLPHGLNTLRWRYFKDSSITLGQDRGWLDQVVYVPNLPPTNLSLSLSASNIVEGDSVTLSGMFSDPDAGDSHQVVIEWGDGSAPFNTTLGPGVLSLGAVHLYLDDSFATTGSGTNQIQVTVADTVGMALASIAVAVRDLPPLLQNVAVTTPILQYDTVTLSGEFGEPGVVDAFHLSVDWGDGTPTETSAYVASNAAFHLQHIYLVANTNPVVTLFLVDDDGGNTGFTTNVSIRASAARPEFLAFNTAADGHRHLALSGTPGANYQIQASEDLRRWRTIAIRTARMDGGFDFEEAQGTPRPRQYYRAIWESQWAGARFGEIARQTNEQIVATLIGLPGRTYRVESSTNMNDWTYFAVITAGTNGQAQLNENLLLAPRKYYRCVYPP